MTAPKQPISAVWKEMAIRHYLDDFEDKDGNELDASALFDLLQSRGKEGRAQSVFQEFEITVGGRYTDDTAESIGDYIVNMATLCQGHAHHDLAVQGLVAVAIDDLKSAVAKADQMIHDSVSDDCAFGHVVIDLRSMEEVLVAYQRLIPVVQQETPEVAPENTDIGDAP